MGLEKEESMTLEEAIVYCQKVVDECPWPGTVEAHKQLLAWLEELRERRMADQ